MKMPAAIADNLVAYVFTVVMGFCVLGITAWLDARHIGRVEMIQMQAWELDQDINRLELYNKFGGNEKTRPARDQIIMQLESDKAKLMLELEMMGK